jgi:hypothetical protein
MTTTGFKPGDIVRCVKQASIQCVHTEGLVGWIEELQEADGKTFAYFRELKLDGGCGGMGSIETECLVHEPGEQWKRAYEAEQARTKKFHDESDARQKRWQEHLKKVAKEFGVSTTTAIGIHDRLGEFG